MRTLSIALALALASPVAMAGLKFGSAIANRQVETGETEFAHQSLDLSAARPSALASLEATMDTIELDVDAFIRSQLLQRSAVAQAQVEFTDAVTVTAPGVPPGAPLTLRLSFYVSGTTFLSTSSNILCTSRIAAVGPNRQQWEKTDANDGTPLVDDPNGTVVFEIPVVEGDPARSEVLVAFIAESICGIPGSTFPSNYFSRADCSLNAQFLNAKVADATGRILPIWMIESESLFDYGEGTDPAVLSNPALAMAFPPDAPDTVRLSWQTSELEVYTLESSPDLVTWSTAATVDGNDRAAEVDLSRSSDHQFYRLVTRFNSGGGVWNP